MNKFENYGKALQKIAMKAARTITSSGETSLIKHKQDVTFEILSSEPIKIVDMKSAKNRAIQWINQKQQFDQVELAVNAYKFYHRMSLIYIYEDFKAYVAQEYHDDTTKQEVLERQLEREIFCALQNIVPRTERRRKDSAVRIRCLINAGITFDQIVNTGMTITDFEADNPYFNKFLLALNLQEIKNLSRSETLLEPSSVEPITPKTMLNKLAKSINKFSNLNQVEFINEGDNSGSSSVMDLDS